ncbi:pre-coat protein AV2 [Mungbean yellow mosaic India virus-[Soybean]]|uniref:Protein V2 n=1 Tax=Indian mungbean yellow mosaic virus TaxID=88774 RepID=Q77I63_9GEMI|nr:pre-coat protein [Indian mungbean yellow mosaic virus]AAL00891.1 pre-coat protein AV2 [Mungbean yellow mosaic India virus-[Soybean]]
MWDPLLNDFPKSVHGFRCMLAIKYLQQIQENYPSNSLGYSYLTGLIKVLRIRNHAKADLRYCLLYPDIECTEEIELRYPAHAPCLCGRCPYQHEKEALDKPPHVEETSVLSAV